VEHFLKLSLQKLKLDYVDLYLIHFPVGFVGNKDDNDLFPKDDNGMSLLEMNTDHISLWKVPIY
jgi:aldehyde reductase